MSVVEGDVSDEIALEKACADQEIVVASLAGEMDAHARHIVKAMEEQEVKRLVFITSLGVYDEVPGAFGRWNNKMIGEDLQLYRKAAASLNNQVSNTQSSVPLG